MTRTDAVRLAAEIAFLHGRSRLTPTLAGWTITAPSLVLHIDRLQS